MSEEAIVVRYNQSAVTDCNSVIIVPEKAVDEAGYIKTVTMNAHAHSKHEFHAMTQMAYFQVQDGELNIQPVAGAILVESGGEVERLDAGMVIYRDMQGNFHVLAHAGQNGKKLLEAAYRFCTRWVRLDI